MTQTPSPKPTGSSSEYRSKDGISRPQVGRWRRLGFILKASVGMAIALTGAIGYWKLSSYVHTRLVPQVEASLLNVLDRPIDMGEVQGFSPIGIRFGKTVLPPTPDDRDQGQVEAVQVRFNPLELLFKRQLSLHITLIEPEVLIDQDETGAWLKTQVQQLEPGAIKISLSNITLKNGTIALFPLATQVLPQSSPQRTSIPAEFSSPLAGIVLPSQEWIQTMDSNFPVLLQKVKGSVELRNDNQVIELDIKSQLKGAPQRRGYRLPQQVGRLAVEGVVNLDSADEAPLFLGKLDTRHLPLTAIAPLANAYLPPQVGTVTDGFLHSNVRIRVADPQLGPSSVALAPDLTLWGDARIGDAAIQLPSMSDPIDQIKGQFLFKGERINLKNIRARYGEVRAIASGLLHLKDGYNIVADVPSVSIQQVLDTTKLELPLETKGTFKAKMKVTGDLNNPIIAGTVTNKGAVLVDKLRLNTVESRLRATLEAVDINTVEVRPKMGGSIVGSGQLTLGERPDLNLQVVAQDLPGDKLLRRFLSERLTTWLPDRETSELWSWPNPETGQPIKLGAIASDISITGPLNRLQAIAQFQAPQASFPTQGTVQVQDQVLSLIDMDTELTNGRITTNATVDLESQQWQGNVALNQLAFNQFPLNQVPWAQLPLDAIPPNPLISTAGFEKESETPNFTGILEGQMEASGTLAAFHPGEIALNGQFQVSDAPLLNSPLSTTFQWSGTRLQLDTFETPQLTAQGWVDIPFQGWVPSLGTFDLGVTLEQLDLANWELPFPQSLYIAGLTDFDGRIFGTVDQPQVNGLLQFEGLTLNQIQMEPIAGPVQFSRGQGLSFDLRGNRDRLSATLDRDFRPVNFDLVHSLTAQTTTRIYGEIDGASDSSANGDRLLAHVEQFPLAALNLKPAEQFQLGAVGGILNGNVAVNMANWDWQQANPLDTLDMEGKVAIAQPRLGYLTAECFQGDIHLVDGIADLQNGQLRIKRYFAPDEADTSLPSSCDSPLANNEGRYTLNGRLTANPTLAFNGHIGVEQGHIQEWLRTLQFFDIQDLSRGLRPATWNRAREIRPFPLPFARVDSNRIISPPVPSSSGPNASPSNTTLLQQLQRYAEILALREQQRRQRQNEFALPQLQDLDGTFFGSIDLAVTAEHGVTAEFDLAGENWRWGDYTAPNQLIAQGDFSNGTLTFLPLRFQSGASRLNFSGSFGWGDDATGQFEATNISVAWLRQFFRLPLDIDGNLNANAAITGNLQNPQARGKISLSNAQLNREPIQSATAQFVYNNARLGVLGDMQLQENNDSAPTDTDGGEELPSTDDAPPSQLISLKGSLPYRFPQATVEPERDDIDLNISLKDDGIGLLNLLNEHVSWEDGTGTITLDVGGTLRQTDDGIDFRPTIDGTALVDNATFMAQVLPAPLTDVSGDIRFDGDRITVHTFEGRFSDGDFTAAGVIPLLNPFTPEELASLMPALSSELSPDPDLDESVSARSPSQQLLSLSLNDLAMNLKGVYNGGVDGRINLRGTALAPQIGGQIFLSDGRVSLPDPAVAVANDSTTQEDENVWAGLIATPELTDLQVTLGKDLLITRLPILNFVATGDLRVNGPLQTDMSAIAPDGVITLHSGQVNLFTTQLNLDRSHNNTATFKPGFGSDPILDVQLETSVLEDNRRRQPIDSNLSQSEVVDRSLGDLNQLQTIRIQAAVKGPASQLFDSIDLTSSPGRSEAEIVALMGGGFVDTLGRSEGFIGIANLAGTALFTSLQTLVSNAIGFSDFRVFPTVITDEDREEEGGGDVRTTSILALAAELGIRLTDDVSVSALQLLTVEEPTQYNLRYQINEELLLRGSTNFSDDNRIILEFETRF